MAEVLNQDPVEYNFDTEENLDQDEVVDDNQEQPITVDEDPSNNNIPEPPAPPVLDETVAALLKAQGISDPSRIIFEDGNGNHQEIAWNNLTLQERMNMLRGEDPEIGLSADEINMLNEMRQSNMTPEQFKNYYKQAGAKEYANNKEPEYNLSVNQLTDDELFILDLQSKVEDLTDEEALAALDTAKQNEALYARQVEGLRRDYQAKEERMNQEEAYAQQQEKAQQFGEFKNSVLNSIQSLTSIGDIGINLDNDDKENLASFILDTDDTGVSYLGKALNDPQLLVQLAWFALHGADTFNSISDYMAEEIKRVGQSNYDKGYRDGQNRQPSSRVVYQQPQRDVNSYLDLI